MLSKIFLSCVLISLARIDLVAQCDYSKPSKATEDGLCNTNLWVLEFEDNFDGDALDLRSWQNQTHSQGPLKGAPNQEYSSMDNVKIRDGNLEIEIRQETVERMAVNWHPKFKLLADSLPNFRTYQYTSAVLWTKEQFHHGKFEISCTLPKGKGLWPSFWTFSSDSGVWNEIDVFEFGDVYGPKFLGIGGKYKAEKAISRHRMNSHYDFDRTGGHHNCPKHKDITDFSIGLHKFELIWTPYIMEWLVDGKSVRKKYKYTKWWGMRKINLSCLLIS